MLESFCTPLCGARNAASWLGLQIRSRFLEAKSQEKLETLKMCEAKWGNRKGHLAMPGIDKYKNHKMGAGWNQISLWTWDMLASTVSANLCATESVRLCSQKAGSHWIGSTVLWNMRSGEALSDKDQTDELILGVQAVRGLSLHENRCYVYIYIHILVYVYIYVCTHIQYTLFLVAQDKPPASTVWFFTCLWIPPSGNM